MKKLNLLLLKPEDDRQLGYYNKKEGERKGVVLPLGSDPLCLTTVLFKRPEKVEELSVEDTYLPD